MGMSKNGAQNPPQSSLLLCHISPSFLKKVCPILRHARVFCTETLPNFLHHWRRRSSSPGRNVFHVCPCLQRTRQASIASTCATPCNARDLLRFAFSTGSSSFVLKNIEFQSAACFRHLWDREWLKKMFADKTELWEHEMQSETTRKPASLLFAPLLQRGHWGPCWKFQHRTLMPEVARDWVFA